MCDITLFGRSTCLTYLKHGRTFIMDIQCKTDSTFATLQVFVVWHVFSLSNNQESLIKDVDNYGLLIFPADVLQSMHLEQRI